MALETRIAETHWDRTLRRNPEITYNKVSRDELLALAGDFPLATFLGEMGLAEEQTFLVSAVPPTPEELAVCAVHACSPPPAHRASSRLLDRPCA